MSDTQLRRLSGALATVGLGVAGYLTYVHYAGLKPVCGISHGCETVQTSQYAYLATVPVALLGAFAYVGVIATSLSRSQQALLAAFGISLIGFAFSAYLTYREVFTIHAICSWCVSSAVIFTLLAAVNSARAVMHARILDPAATAADNGFGDQAGAF
jgi:uncharacterized membrane protein